MSGRDVTYGQLMDQALLELSRVLAGPVRLAGTDDAVTAAQARTRIYRTAARIIQLCTGRVGAAQYNSVGLSAADLRDLEYLHVDLANSIAVTQHLLRITPQLPQPRSVPARLLLAADAAGLARDLLSADLALDGQLPDPAGGWLHGAAARAVLADALLLVRGIASLDSHLEPAVWTVIARSATPTNVAAALRQVAEDCHTIFLMGTAATARSCLHRIPESIPSGIRKHIDSLAPAGHGLPSSQPAAPARRIEAIERYLTWLHRRSADLTAPDLTSLAAIGSRLAHLVAAHAPLPNPPAGAAAVQAWRELHHHLSPLRTIHPRPTGFYQPHRLAAWIDRHLHSRRTHPDWPAAAATISTQLPTLATAGQTSLRQLHAAGHLYLPDAHPDSPYDYHRADDPTINAVHRAFDTAHHASTHLTLTTTMPSARQKLPEDLPVAEPVLPDRPAEPGIDLDL